MRRLAAAALCAVLALGACARPAPVPIRAGGAYGVYKADGRKVMILKNGPGKLVSRALLGPEQRESPSHPWLGADSLDAQEESSIRDVLDRSKDFEAFVRGLEKAGYGVKLE